MTLTKLERRPEIDALRGLFLVWMTLTHLPTRFSDFVNQPIGFVTSAEGFVLISALLVGRLYIRESAEDPANVRARLWKRSLKIYGYHLFMLALAFTVVAEYAVRSHAAALTNLLNFYLAHPLVAVVGSVLLVYCPPLLDILPMYVTFLFFTPMILSAAVRFGWRRVLAASGAVWLLAQFGLRNVIHDGLVHAMHLPIPLQETGAFNLLAWQVIWTAGLWMGARSATQAVILKRVPRWAAVVAAGLCVIFVGIRHGWLGPALTEQALGMALDKWQIGPLRMLNLLAFALFFYWLRKYVVRLLAVEPLLTLGKASLRVFCAHLVFVFVGLALLYSDAGGEMEHVHGATALTLLVATFTGLLLVAAHKVHGQRAHRVGMRAE